MFFKGSRYERVEDYVARDVRGNKNRVKRIRRIEKPEDALTYVIKEGDRLDILAYIYYEDPTKSWLICDANNAIFPSDLLVPGKKIIIPQEGL
jgi:nucleoid-associated protein YgaU